MARTPAETGDASDRAHSVPPGVGRAPQSPPEPAACAPRVGGLDLARCLAIFGMVYVNFEVVLAAGEREPRWLGVLAACTEGRAAATFVVLAGIGLVLLDRRAVIARRALFLLLLGFAWQLVWPGDILHYYAFYLAVGALSLRLRAGGLWCLAALSIAAFGVLFGCLDYGAGWHWETLSYPEFWTPAGQLHNLLFNGWHPLFPWLAFLFAGMALGRWGLWEVRNRRTALALSAVIFLAAHFLSQALAALPDERPLEERIGEWYRAPEAFWSVSSLPPGPLYMLSAGASAVFVIALCLEACARPSFERRTRQLSRAGRYALSFYIAHVLFLYFGVIVVTSVLDVGGSGPGEPLEWAAGGTAVFCAFAVAFAAAWGSVFRRGPLEWLMRRLCG